MDQPWLARLGAYFGFSGKGETLLWSGLSLTLAPLSLVPRFWFWSNALLEPHPIRQTQTALTAYYLHHKAMSVFDYRSPLNGALWNFVYEFPLYQWLTAKVMDLGANIEVAARSVTMAFFVASGVVLVCLVNRWFGRRIAAWTGLLWLLSPFNIIYSRACLIDFCTVFFSLASLGLYLDIFFHRRPLTWKVYALATILGSVAAITKATIWFSPAGLQGVLLLGAVIQAGKITKQHRILGAGLFLQLLAAVAWMRWANYLRAEPGILTTEAWIFGAFSQRFEWQSWKRFGGYVFMSVLQGWMVIPFVVGVASGLTSKRAWTIGLLFLILLPPLVTFNVHSRHDYYLIGEISFYLILVAFGMAKLFSLPKKKAQAAWAMMAVLFAWRLKNVPVDFATVTYDYRIRLSAAFQLKQFTVPEDIVHYDAGMQDYEIPLYSERMVGLGGFGPGRFDPAGPVTTNVITPTVFKLMTDGKDLNLLKPFDLVWAAGAPEFLLYRVAKKGKFGFNPAVSLAVAATVPRLPDYRFEQPETLTIKARPHPSSYLVVELLGRGNSVAVTATHSGAQYLFPKRNFLMLPAPPSDHPETYEITLAP